MKTLSANRVHTEDAPQRFAVVVLETPAFPCAVQSDTHGQTRATPKPEPRARPRTQRCRQLSHQKKVPHPPIRLLQVHHQDMAWVGHWQQHPHMSQHNQKDQITHNIPLSCGTPNLRWEAATTSSMGQELKHRMKSSEYFRVPHTPRIAWRRRRPRTPTDHTGSHQDTRDGVAPLRQVAMRIRESTLRHCPKRHKRKQLKQHE